MSNKIPASYYLDKPEILQGVLDGMEAEYQKDALQLAAAQARIGALEAALSYVVECIEGQYDLDFTHEATREARELLEKTT